MKITDYTPLTAGFSLTVEDAELLKVWLVRASDEAMEDDCLTEAARLADMAALVDAGRQLMGKADLEQNAQLLINRLRELDPPAPLETAAPAEAV